MDSCTSGRPDRVAAAIEQAAQRTQRRLLTARQHQTGVGLHGEAGVLSVFAVVDLDMIALLQVTQQPLVGFLQRIRRHGKALVAGAQQEIGDVRGQPVFLFAVRRPQAEAAVVTLHADQSLDAQFDLALALGI